MLAIFVIEENIQGENVLCVLNINSCKTVLEDFLHLRVALMDHFFKLCLGSIYFKIRRTR